MDSGLLIVGVLVAAFAAIGLGLVAFAARHGARDVNDSRQALGISAGMLVGAALGTIAWLSTGEFMYWVISIGGGMMTGLALGSARPPKPR